MYKKLDEKNHHTLLEAGIGEFAGKGFDKANMSQIAKEAGLSVGVIYKYYGDKDSFFLACVRHSLKLLDETLTDAMSEGEDLLTNMRKILTSLVKSTRTHKSYYIMYHEITTGACNKFAKQLAEEIETISSNLYITLLQNARDTGKVRTDMDCRMFAFFFDNLLMMLHFSYCCDYYQERMRIYCGGEFPDDQQMVDEMMKLMNGALGVSGA